MKVAELLEMEPKAQAYELKRDGRYLICFDGKHVSREMLSIMEQKLRMIEEREGIRFVGLLSFIPTIFELEPEKEI